MTFAAILTVKDEADLLHDAIAHLRWIGVDRIVAIDAGSTDGSTEILERCRDGDRFVVARQSDLDPDPTAWGRTAAELAAASGADWTMFLDPDEYWIPATGRLQDTAALQDPGVDLVKVARFNVPLRAGRPAMPARIDRQTYTDLFLICEPPSDFRAHVEADAGVPWIRGVPMPKLLVRPGRLRHVEDGGHRIVSDGGAPLREEDAGDLLIAHVPFTTVERFRRKVDNIRQVFAVHDGYFGTQLAWHWRRWLALRTDAEITAEFHRQAFDPAAWSRLQREGVLRSADDLLRSGSVRPIQYSAVV